MIDVGAVALQMQLDDLALAVCRALGEAGIPHVTLKGPSTARWLYDPPRAYRDVDVLVPASRVEEAAGTIAAAGLASASTGTFGEAAPHSVVLLSLRGLEIDLHATLPMLDPEGAPSAAEVWSVLSGHITEMELGAGALPVLDTSARCVVLALHRVASGETSPQVREDLDRALARADEADWLVAGQIAEQLGIAALFDAGLNMDEARESGLPIEVYLRTHSAPGAAFGLRRLASRRTPREKAAYALRELVPSRDFMRRAYPMMPPTNAGLIKAHAMRWRHLAKVMPAAVRTLWQARKQAP